MGIQKSCRESLLIPFIFAILFALGSSMQNQNPLDDSNDASNFVERFNLENLDDFVAKRKFVVVLFDQFDQMKNKLSSSFFSLANRFEQKHVYFLQANKNDFEDKLLKNLGVDQFPSIILFVYGFKKRFTMELNDQNLNDWLEQILEARCLTISSLDEVKPKDKHFFAHANFEWIKANPTHFDVLAKLIAPRGIYTGLPKETILGKFRGNINESGPIFIFREVDGQILSVDKNLPLNQKAEFIIENEFLPNYECNDKVSKLLLEQKFPALIYFGISQKEKDQNWRTIEETHRHFKEFMLLVYFDLNSKSKMCHFIADFLKVKKEGELRILDLTNKVKRFKYNGKYEKNELKFFLENYIEGNLKAFKLSEHLTKARKHRGILASNYASLNSIIKKRHINALFVVYSKNIAPLKMKEIEILRFLGEMTEANKTFKIFSINHDKNDIDGQLHLHLPFVFLVTRLGRIAEFKEAEISVKHLVHFFLSNVPYLKLKEPEIDTDL